MTSFKKQSIQLLHKLKNRITNPRKAILTILEKLDYPVSPYKLQELIKKRDLQIDVVTIYRNLEYMQELKLVHYIRSEKGFIRCRCLGEDGLHIFLKCIHCHTFHERAIKFRGELDFFFKRNIREPVEQIYLELDIRCETCQQHTFKKGA